MCVCGCAIVHEIDSISLANFFIFSSFVFCVVISSSGFSPRPAHQYSPPLYPSKYDTNKLLHAKTSNHLHWGQHRDEPDKLTMEVDVKKAADPWSNQMKAECFDFVFDWQALPPHPVYSRSSSHVGLHGPITVHYHAAVDSLHALLSNYSTLRPLHLW